MREILAPAVTVRGEQGISWTLTQNTAAVGDELILDAVAGAAAMAAVSYQIVSPGASGCAWKDGDPDSLTLAFTNAGICRVRAIATLSDYEDWAQVEEIVVSPGTQTGITWTPTQTTGTVGTPLILPAASGTADANSIIYERDNDDGSTSCTFGAGSVEAERTLSFATQGTCRVRVRTTRAGYEDWTSAGHAILVTAGTQTGLAWSISGGGVVGEDFTLSEVSGAEGATVTYAVTDAGTTGCTENAGVLSFDDTGSGTDACTVQATATRTGYGDWTSAEIPIAVAEGTITGVNWNPGATSFIDSASSTSLAGVTGARAGTNADTVTYEIVSDGNTNCEFSDSTAASSFDFDTAGTCTVRAVVERDGYGDWTSPDFAIEITSLAPVAITWAGYDNNNVATFGTTPILQTPTYNPASPASTAYEFISIPPGACSVDANSGALTVTGVGSCVVTHTATRSGSGNGRISAIVTINPGAQTVTAGTPYTAPASFAVGDTLALGTAPTGAMESAAISYRGTDAAVCTLASDGEITATGVGTCAVEAQFAATANYQASSWTQIFTLSVVQADQAAPSGTDVYGTSPALAARGTLRVQNAPAGGGERGALTYASTTATVCSVSAATGEVTALETGTCTVSANWAGDANYNPSPVLQVLSITISQGTQPAPASAAAYGTNPTVKRAGTLPIGSAPTGGAGTLTYTSADTAICTVAGDGTVSGVAVGSCLISAQWGGNTHVAASDTVPLASIEVTRGDQGAPTASDIYGTSPSLATGRTLARTSAPGGGGANGSARYQTTTPTICSVTEGTGLITALADGNCIVQARWGGDAQFSPSPWQIMQTVAITPINFEIARWGEFSGRLIVGGGTKRPSKSRAKIRRVDFGYALATGETDCTLEDANTGEVRASAADFADPYCTITITASKAGYTPLTEDIAILLQKGTLAFATTPSYTGTLSVGTTLTVQDAELSDDNGIAVTWNYAAEGERQGAPRSGVCDVSATGEVSVETTARAGDACLVSATASAAGYMDFQKELRLTVAALSSAIAWTPASTSGTLGTDIDLGAITLPQNFPAGSHTRYGVTDAGTTNCYFRGDSGTLAHTLAFSAAGTCKVKAFNTHPLTQDWESSEHEIAIAAGSAGTPTQVAVGKSFACALFGDNSLKCWGDNAKGQLGLGHSDDLGDNPHEMGGALPFVDVSADGVGGVAQIVASHNADHVCAILRDGRLKCWGDNTHGQLGLGDSGNTNHRGDGTGEMGSSLDAVNLGDGETAVHATLGKEHTCAILEDSANNKTLKCWGRNNRGQLGYGNTTDLNAPASTTVNLRNDRDGDPFLIEEITAGANYTCARSQDNEIKCWGETGSQIHQSCVVGISDVREPPAGVLNLERDDNNIRHQAHAISAGSDFTCALLNGDKLMCWGQNDKSQIVANTASICRPTRAPSIIRSNLDGVSAGTQHLCELSKTGIVSCRGHNDRGQIGIPNAQNSSTITYWAGVGLGSGRTVSQLASGNGHNCALLDNGALKCWGGNGSGQLGLGDTGNRGDNNNEMGDNLPATPLLSEGLDIISSVAWASFPASAEVGGSVVLTAPSGTPALDDWSAAVVGGDCTWDENTETLAFSGVDTCVISLTAKKDGYAQRVELFSVTPSPASQSGIAWSPSQATGTVGSDLLLDAVSGSAAGATVSYEISDAGETGCAFKGNGDPDERTLIFLAAGTCQVIATSSGENIEPWESPTPFSIAVKHAQTLTPPQDAYGSTPTLIIPGTLVLQKFPSDGKKRPEFRAKDGDESVCKVDPHNGRVTSVTAGSCEVEVRWPGGTEYYASNWKTLGTVAIQAPLQPQTGIAWSPSQNEGVVGTDLEFDPVTATDGNSVIEYLISSMGDTGCAFGSGDAQSERTLTFTEAGTCIVQARSTLAGHFAWRSQTFSISVRHAQTLELPDDAPYGDNINFFSGTTLALLNPPTGGDGALEFRTTAASTNWCEVDPASGMVTGKGISQGDAQQDCVIEARWGETSTHYASSWEELATLTVLPPPDPLQTGLAWAATNTGKVGVELVLPAVTGADAGAALTYTISSPGTTACAWKDGDASTLTLIFTKDGTCEVQARSVLAGHQPWSASVEIVVALGTQLGLAWSHTTTAPAGTVGTPLTLDAVTGADNADSVTYEKTTAPGNSICSFGTGANERVLTFSDSGTCIVQAVVTRSGYEDWTSAEVSIVVAKGTQTGLVWAATNTAPTGKVGETTTLPAVTGADNADSVTYEKTTAPGNSICALSGRALTFSDSGTCIVQAVVTRSGYDTLTLGPVPINVALGDLSGLSWSVGTTTFIKTATPILPEVTGKQNGDTIVYTVTSQGSTGCSFGTGTDVRKLEFTAAGTCKVQATLTRTGYNPWPSPEISLGITNADPVVIVWTGYGSGNNANKGKVGETSPALQTPTLTPSDATPTYSTASSGVCSVTSGGDLTIIGVGDCVVKLTATPSDTNANVVTTSEITVAISRGDQSVTPANNPYGASPALKAGLALALVNAPTGQKESAATTYQSTDSNICAVDETGGEISAKKVGDCVVQAQFAQTANYEQTAWTTIATLTIGKGTQVAPTASNPYGTSPALAVGGTLDVQTAPSGGGGHGGLEYESSFPAACTVDATSGRVSGKKAQNCVVRVRWKGNDDYDASGFTSALTLNVGKGTQAAPTASSPYGSSPQVAVDAFLPIANAPSGGHGLPRYSSSDENVCGMNTNNGTVRGVKEGTCQIKAHFRGDSDYLASPEATIATITVIKSNQDAPDASDIYGASPTLITDGTLSLDTAPSGGGQEGDIEYRVLSSTSSICRVDSTTGTVTALLDGNCTIEARWSGVDGEYNASPYATMQTITIGKASIAGVSWGSFSGNLKVGGATATPSASTFTTAGVGVSYAIKSGNTNCALESGGTTTGEVRANSVNITPGTPVYCVVVISAAKAGYNSEDQDIQIPLELGDLVLATAGFPTYTGTLSVGGSVLNPQNPPATDDNNIAIAWTYDVQGERFTAPQTGVCDVIAGTGEVSIGNGARAGDVCKITATASATGYNDETSLVGSINVVAATQSVTWNVPAATRSAAKIGGDLILPAPSGVPNGASVNYEVTEPGTANCFFRFEGNKFTSKLSFTEAGTCKVKLVSTHRGYNPWESSPITITVAANTATIVQIEAGGDDDNFENFACARFSDGSLKCWGENVYGQLGLGDNDNRIEMGSMLPFVDLGVGKTATQIALRGSSSCAILNNGELKCWGYNGSGQLGLLHVTNQYSPPSTPVDLGQGKTAQQVAQGGAGYACAVLDDNSLKCWGQGWYGQLGNGKTQGGNPDGASSQYTPTAVNLGNSRSARQVALGYEHTCALLDDFSVKCWGRNQHGQAGRGASDPRYSRAGAAVQLGTSSDGLTLTAQSIATGNNHSCAITDGGGVKCWGLNDKGQLGIGNTDNKGRGNTDMSADLPFVNLGAGRTATMLAAGMQHTCALLDDGSVKCWGRNNEGQLGLENTTDLHAPSATAIDLGSDGQNTYTATAISAAEHFTCALLNNGRAKCWGTNGQGQLGQGHTDALGDAAGEMGNGLPFIDLFGTDTSYFISLAWDTFPTSATVGVDSAALSGPVSNPVFDSWSAKVIAGNCAWNANTKVLSYTGTLPCQVAVTAEKAGYQDKTVLFSVTPTSGTQTGITWDAGATEMVLGTELLLGAVAGADSSASNEYAVVDVGTSGCAFKAGAGADARTLTATSVGTCQVHARSVRAGYMTWVSQTVSIAVKRAQTLTVPAGPYGSTPQITPSGTLEIGTAPSGGHGTLEYRSKDTGICTVDENGKVTAVALGDCEIEVRWAGNSEYQSSSWVGLATVKILPAQSGITWTPGASSGTVGTDLVLAALSGSHNSAINTYTVADAGTTGCSFKGTGDPDERTLVFTDAGTCKVQAESARTGYVPWKSSEVSIVVAKGTQTGISWNPATMGAVGRDLVLDAVTGADDSATVAYAITSAGTTGCAWKGGDATSLTLVFTGVGTCKVEAQSSLSGYDDWSKEISVGVFLYQNGISWTPAVSGAEVGTELPLAAVSGAHGSATVTYAVTDAGNTGCSFKGTGDPDERTLVFGDVGICKVAAKSERTGYADWQLEIAITVVLPSLELVWNPPTRAITASNIELPAVSGADASSATITYTITNQGTTGCAWVGINFERLKRTLQFTGPGTCKVRALATRTGYKNWQSQEISVQVSNTKYAQTLTAPANPYGADPTINVRWGQIPRVNIQTRPTGGHGGLEYRITSPDFQGDLACIINSGTGNIGSGAGESSVQDGLTCEVEARWKGNAVYLPSPWVEIAVIKVIAVAP